MSPFFTLSVQLLFHIFSEREPHVHVRYNRPSVCLSVCNVRAPYSAD